MNIPPEAVRFFLVMETVVSLLANVVFFGLTFFVIWNLASDKRVTPLEATIVGLFLAATSYKIRFQFVQFNETDDEDDPA